MSSTSSPLPPRHTLWLLLGSMLLTAMGLRVYLHGVRVQHIYPGGFLFHHLFTGILICLPAAFILAFGTRLRWLAIVVRLALGVGAGLMLDEISYLVMTRASDDDYVSWTSLFGAIVFVSVASGLVLGLYCWHETKHHKDSPTAQTNSPGDTPA